MNFEDLKACCDRLLDFCGSCCGYPNECGKCEVPIVEGFTVDDHKNEPGHAADACKPRKKYNVATISSNARNSVPKG